MPKNDDGAKLAGLVFECARTILEGQDAIVISIRDGRRVPGFPKGELMSVNQDGVHNYAVCPVKVLTWIHKQIKGA
jgi:hypothetical protein